MILQSNARNASVDAATALWNGGTITFYNSGAPATTIITVTIPSPAFGAAATGSATANSYAEATATSAGTVNAYSVKNSIGTLVCSGTVGLTGSGADFIFTDTAFNIADRLQITGITYTQPAS